MTILVGAQGTGKSLALQWLKIAIDGKQVISALREAGQKTSNQGEIIDLIFGSGMGSSWGDDSKIEFQGKSITPKGIARIGTGRETLVFSFKRRKIRPGLVMGGLWQSAFRRHGKGSPPA